MHHIAITLATIVLVGFICQWVAWRLKLPAILPLLAVGILLGPITGFLVPHEIIGDLLHPMVSLAVAIILFEGGLTLEWQQIRQVRFVVQKLVTVGALIVWVIVATSMHYVFGLDRLLAALFGALMVVTGPTVIVPMLRTVRPNANISNILRWEGILIDPVGALFAVLVYEFIVSSAGGSPFTSVLALFFKIIVIGTFIGIVTAKLLERALKYHLIPEYLHNMATLAFVLFGFSLSNLFAEESGLLAVTVMGIWLANAKVHIEDILNFKENLTVLLISILFIVLAAQLDLSNLMASGVSALGAFLVVQFVARPISVFFCTLGSKLNWRERVLIGWIGPRGIVAAAISALFALQLAERGFENADLLVSLTFTVIIGTVLLQSLTAGPIGRLLGVSDPEPHGLLIVGASPVARAIASELKDNGVQTLMTASSYENFRAARMEGLNTYYGHPVSEHADQHLDLVGIGNLIALSPRKEINTISCMRYSNEFGRNRIYHVANTTDSKQQEKHQTAAELRGATLFGQEITYKKLSSLYKSKEMEVRTTGITDEFTGAHYDELNPKAIKLFLLRGAKRAIPYTDEHSPETKPGDKIVALLPTREPREKDEKG